MRFKQHVLSVVTFLLLLAGVGCDANRVTTLPSGISSSDPLRTVIQITPDSATLAVGDLVAISARVTDSDGFDVPNANVRWAVSSGARVRLTTDGVVEGVAEGEDTVVASFNNSSATSVFRIRAPKVASIAVSLDPSVVEVGRQARASAVLRARDGSEITGRVYWTSSNTAVARVNQEGLVTTRAPGRTRISGIAEGKVDSEELTVQPAQEDLTVASVTVSSNTFVVYVGRTAKLTAVVRDQNGNTMTSEPVTWRSSNPAVATVSSAGDVSGMSVGTATFTAAAEAREGQATLPVQPVPVNSVQLQLNPTSVTVGGTSQAQATTYDSEGDILLGRNIAFVSSNTSVATVSSLGLVTSVAAGSANITATSEGKSASAALVVNALVVIPVASVSVSVSDNSLDVGQTTQALAVPRDAGGNALPGRAVTWSSSNGGVATVGSNGVVTAVAGGTTYIRGTSEGQTGSAAVTVTAPAPPPPAPVVTYFGVTPASASLILGATQQFQNSATWSDGATRQIVVSYSATGGTISAGGLYTAGQTAGVYRVIAVCDCGLADTVPVTLSLPPQQTPSLTGVELTPATATVTTGQTRAFAAVGRYSDGTTGPVSITWSATGGVISPLGLYTAGQVAGSFLVVAACSCGFSDTSTVTVSPPAIASMTVAPATVNLVPGQSYQFVANGWLPGATTPIATPATWTATGGSIDQTGRYTAGSVAGTFRVIGQSTVLPSGRDTADVIITIPVASVAVALANSSRTVGQTTQATATLRDAGNNILSGRAITWSSTNNAVATVNSSGLVSAVGAGSASVRATSEGVMGSATLTVTVAQPAPVATVSVTVVSSSINTGGTTQATATLRDALNNILTGRVVVWSSSNPLVASVSATGLVAGLTAGSATITATSEGRSGSVAVSVSLAPPPPPPPVGGFNEPPGLSLTVNYGCEARPRNVQQPTQPTWTNGRITFITENGNNLCRFPNDAGADDVGAGAIVTAIDRPQETYSRMLIRPAMNFLAHPIGTKLLYVFVGGAGDHMIPLLGGSSPGDPITLKLVGNGYAASAAGAPGTYWIPNRNRNAEVVRGQWNTIEFYGRMNTPGQSNGVLRMWINNSLVIELTDIRYSGQGWGEHDLLIYHGGRMGVPTQMQASYLDVDYFYVSGR